MTVGQLQAPAGLSRRARVTQARAKRAGEARRHQGGFDRGWWAGTDRWGLYPPGRSCGGPATEDLAVTADARGLAAASDGFPVGCRVPTVRQRQGQAAWQERRATEVVGLAGRTSDAQEGTPAPGGHRPRRDFPATPIPAGVVRKGQGQALGPGGTPVFLTKAAGQPPWAPLADDEERRLLAHCGSKASQPPWSLRPPPQNTARARRVPMVLTRLLCGLATASRRRGEAVEAGTEPVGWPCWRRQRLPQTRDQLLGCAPGSYGIFPLAALVLLRGVTRKEVPPGLGTPQETRATYRLTSHD